MTENRARCDECGDELVSTWRHDFVTCSCGKLSVDGGLSHARRVYTGSWTDLTGQDTAETSPHLTFTLDLNRAPASFWQLAHELDDLATQYRWRPAHDEDLTSDLIVAIHKLLVGNGRARWGGDGGAIRTESVRIGNYLAPPADQCLCLLDHLCAWLNGPDFRSDVAAFPLGVVKALLAHLYIGWIQPFANGNGRIARHLEVAMLKAAGMDQDQGGLPLRFTDNPAFFLMDHVYDAPRSAYYERLTAARDDVFEFFVYAMSGLVPQLRNPDRSRRCLASVSLDQVFAGRWPDCPQSA